MKRNARTGLTAKREAAPRRYVNLLASLADLLEDARRGSARAVNVIMTATYWEVGRQIVEFEQAGSGRAEYGKQLLARLSEDLSARFGRGFSERNLRSFRSFYSAWPDTRDRGDRFSQRQIWQTVSAKSGHRRALTDGEAFGSVGDSHFQIWQTLSAKSRRSVVARKRFPRARAGKELKESQLAWLSHLAGRFPLPWSHYIKLLSVEDCKARAFYEKEALRGGWSVRQLDRQISSGFFERAATYRKKALPARGGDRPFRDQPMSAEEEIKDPLVMEFLGLKDEYSESTLEEALIRHLESFLLELGDDFTFVARQKRLRVGGEWYRVGLMFFHRRLRCLVIIDLKIGKFTHADAGQMNLYLNYASEHWTHPEENPPVGLVICTKADHAVAHYALGGLRKEGADARIPPRLAG